MVYDALMVVQSDTEHPVVTGQCPGLQNAKILSTKSGYLDHLTMEATKVELQPNNISREDGIIFKEFLETHSASPEWKTTNSSSTSTPHFYFFS
jgi:hypothetical protein